MEKNNDLIITIICLILFAATLSTTLLDYYKKINIYPFDKIKDPLKAWFARFLYIVIVPCIPILIGIFF
jgi:hypothetical protein